MSGTQLASNNTTKNIKSRIIPIENMHHAFSCVIYFIIATVFKSKMLKHPQFLRAQTICQKSSGLRLHLFFGLSDGM